MLKLCRNAVPYFFLFSVFSCKSQNKTSTAKSSAGLGEFEANAKSLNEHKLPQWYDEAKFGIFIHWGLASVPGWAPLTGERDKVVKEEGWDGWFKKNPYSDWYWNSLHIKGSPTETYHIQKYGPNFPYENFAIKFQEESAKWNPQDWVSLFRQAGARYAVLTTKHHDGFLMWPSAYTHRPNFHAKRDIVGEFTKAMNDANIIPGLYYSGGIDWTFNPKVIRNFVDMFMSIPQGQEYIKYANNHWRELIEKYKPKVVWNDIGWPLVTNVYKLLADYYNQVPDGVINDRFNFKNGIVPHDFKTVEYESVVVYQEKKWESTRGLGYSFGYNQLETDAHLISTNDLVDSFVDVVSKNGNLLLNVGPTPDGKIPDIQAKRLVEFGNWMRINEAGIYGSRSWAMVESKTETGDPIRFTRKGSSLYAFLLNTPKSASVSILGVRAAGHAKLKILGRPDPLVWSQTEQGILIQWPQGLPDSLAYAIEITPDPTPMGNQWIRK